MFFGVILNILLVISIFKFNQFILSWDLIFVNLFLRELFLISDRVVEFILAGWATWWQKWVPHGLRVVAWQIRCLLWRRKKVFWSRRSPDRILVADSFIPVMAEPSIFRSASQRIILSGKSSSKRRLFSPLAAAVLMVRCWILWESEFSRSCRTFRRSNGTVAQVTRKLSKLRSKDFIRVIRRMDNR